MREPIYIVDIIKDLVAQINTELMSTIKANEIAALGKSLMTQIGFMNGHKAELIQRLAEKDQHPTEKFKKYPMVYLVQDFKERRGRQPGVYAELSLNIIIMHHTESTYIITDRETNVLKPVLDPIYNALMEKIVQSPWFLQGSDEQLQHDYTFRSYWGTQVVGGNKENTLNDFLDAIEIENLSLKIDSNNC